MITSETAATANAEWCDAMARAHGLDPIRTAELWSSPSRTPPLYPDAVTLSPDVDPSHLLEQVDASDGCSVKDSFGLLDLSRFGFRILFSATWIVGHPHPSSPGLGRRLSSSTELTRWEDAWRRHQANTSPLPDRLFPAPLLDDDRVSVIEIGEDLAGLAGGFILCRGPGAYSLTNQFGVGTRATLDGAGHWLGGLPVTDYRSGPGLAAAIASGFSALGPMRVWIRGSAS